MVKAKTTVRYSAFYTRNLGNFENAKIGYEVEREVEDGQTADELRAELKSKVDKWLEEDIEEIDREAKG